MEYKYGIKIRNKLAPLTLEYKKKKKVNELVMWYEG